MAMQTREETEPRHKNSLKILATKINFKNASDHDQFVCSTQFDLEKPEKYTHIMQDPNHAK